MTMSRVFWGVNRPLIWPARCRSNRRGPSSRGRRLEICDRSVNTAVNVAETFSKLAGSRSALSMWSIQGQVALCTLFRRR